MKKLILSLIAFAFLNAEIVPLPNNVNTFTLENGMEVLTIHNPSSPMVCLNMSVLVGSAYENFATSGMSHMLEHLLFNGTTTRTQAELYDETDFYGMYSNAFTGKFFTDYFLLMPAEFLQNGMDVQSDMLFHSILPNEKFDKERGIVMEEIGKDRDRDSYEISNFFDKMNFGATGVGLPTLGTRSTIEHLHRDDVFGFYKTHYVPNNMLLTVIGNFDENTLKSDLEDFYGKTPPQPIEKYLPSNHKIQNGKFNQTKFKTAEIQGQIVFNAPTYYNKNRFEFEIMLDFLNENLGDLASANYTAYPDLGRLEINFSCESNDDVNVKIDEILRTIGHFDEQMKSLITDEKLALLAKQMEVEDTALLDQLHYYPMMKAFDLALGGAESTVGKLQFFKQMSAEKIIRNVRGFSQKAKQFNVVFPEKITAENAERAEILGIENNKSSIINHKSILPSGATLVTTQSGGSAMFGMHILIKNRNAIEGELQGGAEILHSLLETSTTHFTEDKITEKLAQIGAKIKTKDLGFIPYDNYYNSPEFGYVRFECLENDAETGIRLLTEMLDNTTLTDAKLGSAIRSAQMRIGMQKSTAKETASDEFWKLILGENTSKTARVSGTIATVSRINLDNLTALKDRYFLPENYIISVASSIPHQQLAEIFNSIWQNPAKPTERIVSEILVSGEFQEKLMDLGKEQAQIRIGYTFEIDEADKPAFSLMTDILSSRMVFDLREKQGLAYSLGMFEGYENNVAYLVSSMGTGKENLEIAVDGMKSCFSSKCLKKLTQREIETEVNGGKGHYMMRNLTRIGQAFHLGYYEFYNGDFEKALKRNSVYDGLTVEEIQRVAKKYLELPKNHTIVIVK